MARRDKPVTPLAARLKELRLGKGLKQEALHPLLKNAEQQSTVSGWETGKVPSPAALVELADFYEVDLRWLITGEGVRQRHDLPDATLRLDLIRQLADPAYEIPAELLRGLRMLALGRDLIAGGEADTEQTG